MLIEIIKALLLGAIVAVPIGPVLLLVLQKTLSRGRWTGFVTGIGSAVIDTVYAAIGLYALSLIQEFLTANEDVIMMCGGLLVIGIGLWMALRKEERVVQKTTKGTTAASYALQAAGCALSNPGALVFSFALLAFFGLGAATLKTPSWLIILCVFLGEMTYWNFLTYAIVHFKKFSNRTIRIISHLAGYAIIAFGIFLIVKGLLLHI